MATSLYFIFLCFGSFFVAVLPNPFDVLAYFVGLSVFDMLLVRNHHVVT